MHAEATLPPLPTLVPLTKAAASPRPLRIERLQFYVRRDLVAYTPAKRVAA
jgi:hypothetical protein